MASTSMVGLNSPPQPADHTLAMARASSADSALSVITVGDSSTNALSSSASSSSSPPTSIGDCASISSASMGPENTIPMPTPETGRSRRQRTNVTTYNVKVLTGTAIHAPKKFSKDPKVIEELARRKTISGDTLLRGSASARRPSDAIEKDEGQTVSKGIDALDLQLSKKALPKPKSQMSPPSSPKKTKKQLDLERRKSTRSAAGEVLGSLTKSVSVLGKRGRQVVEDTMPSTRAQRELRNLADTKEYAKIDTDPVILEVWSNGKLVKPETAREKKKREKAEAEKEAAAKVKDIVEPPVEQKPNPSSKKRKVYLSKGLYAGQERDIGIFDWFKGSSRRLREEMENVAPFRPNGFMPLPMWHGQRLLQVGRDFKLPFDVCSPLPPGQPKPDEWRKTSSNRFVGEAGAMWKNSKLFDSCDSKCVCKPEEGCDEDCMNRTMLYECDDGNCASGRDRCTNRAFADLQERRKAGGKYRIGVEVIKTADRGYGVRSNRCFEANQIIVEYTGEIITEEECDRRMNEDYKNNECYYLMSFDQNMIIDATKGSIARFVNHSCNPNCKMVKWIVGGKPRMALFAGDNPIMTGDELTYDYNFDPFSAKNVQECRCGSSNCRGFLGPKPKPNAKEPKVYKELKDNFKAGVKAGVKAVKRKLNELLGGDDTDDAEEHSPKKRKMKTATGVKGSAPSASMKMAKNAGKSVKKSVSSQLLNARNAVGSKRVIKKTMKAKSLKTYGNRKSTISVSRNSSMTMVETESSPRSGKKASPPKKSVGKMARKSVRGGKGASRDDGDGTIGVVSGDEA
ncbi:uncharacterized protein L3040_006140 [Drepanopeziza brunnea f. sp. 'multigermtubi']|uniref:SET domain-containing protein n=1 Tax=Marssonina brunnea f. sp. multigermtubi (strain MB_m1) TaxID=1072389 RepID=K1WUZ2_MARBU|nr:SET domain-containing protein [Drepanopeziza brunnea f. sp. 'multigermtubi' MB_m1]EKD21480.1 SET domain-containing protein [Drepanopeziza brunnea f. sp. 'multigermtubi' MB_m1]KAJ5040484.1 hypothetical protein L3040_006140 [Drepanopeziza brunnea f. sp. 'multigermtubi']